MLKLKVADLKRELRIAKNQMGRMDTLEKEVFRLQREVLQEKTKVKALSEELENPMNVHRWRKLEGSDPATYEMIQKIQTLQRRLISKTEDVRVARMCTVRALLQLTCSHRCRGRRWWRRTCNCRRRRSCISS